MNENTKSDFSGSEKVRNLALAEEYAPENEDIHGVGQ
jgi:hypothetical protein